MQERADVPSQATDDRLAAAVSDLRKRLDRAGYHLQHGSLAVSFGLIVRAVHFAFDPSASSPPASALKVMKRRFFRLLREDLTNVELGYYPRDLLFQFPYLEYARTLPGALADAPRLFSRRLRRKYVDLPPGVDAERYPAYYLRNFHWQTDGWLSDRSAGLYDLEVEVLFQGTADIMRRMAIRPVIDALRGSAAGARPIQRVLDVACGTGRFLLQLHRAAPDVRLYGLDLSPNYIGRARRNLAHVPDATLLVENAEAMPLQDSTFDAVTSVFLFHELPRDARRNVVREVYRVLKPGGRFVICDSAQLSDSPELAIFLDRFEDLYHEPYYKSYVRDDLAGLLSEQGFERVSSAAHFLSKIVAGEKPGASGRSLLE